MKIHKTSTKLLASPKAVITLFLSLPGEDRIRNVVNRVEGLSEDNTRVCMEMTMDSFAGRHRNLQETFRDHYHKNESLVPPNFSAQKKMLIGAYLTKEYSIQSAALFNPSVVPHPDQSQLKRGQLRFVMSLRATGEGHISSIVFQTGIIDRTGDIRLDQPTG